MVDKRVLVIDDDEDIRFTIMEICRSQQWIAREAADYQEAQTVMKEFSPDVILVDYHMPVHDGLWMTREIRKTDRNTSIIVLTIEEKESVVQRFFEAGADDYALKPVKAPDLIARIRLHFKLSEQKRFFKDARKGINEKTVQLLSDYLKQVDRFVGIEEIESELSINYKTLYRYLQYFQDEGYLEIRNQYGKIGRPKLSYKWKKD